MNVPDRGSPPPTRMHPAVAVPLRETAELEALVHRRITSRAEMHIWPLSVVELLTTETGERWVYKVQRPPTVEVEFYRRARSDLLPETTVVTESDGYCALLIKFLEPPTLDDVAPNEEDLPRHGRALLRRIGEIEGDPPVYLDPSTPGRWRRLVATVLEM